MLGSWDGCESGSTSMASNHHCHEAYSSDTSTSQPRICRKLDEKFATTITSITITYI